ncbi:MULTISPECIES: carbon-nitrogen hydrolase family protein [Helicobacter]|uniref:carbon-nitrogen hydrolase family protein n=1 Tax=Helicobacter TaxID=209 RepID=UPI000EAFEBC0|nr:MULTISPECIES: carbon-nitrogen hydrolase family protein [Helicobacter]
MERKVKVAAVQFSPRSYERETNLKHALNLAQKALSSGAKIVLLPELFDSGYCVEDRDLEFGLDLSDPTQPTLEGLKALAKEYKAYLIAGSIEQEGGALFNSIYIVGEKGVVGKYQKVYLWGDEKQRFSRGQEYRVFELPLGDFSLKVGLQICYEVGFSEGSRFLALQGAELLCFCAAFSKIRSYAWDLGGQARALENGVFVLAANRCGSEISKISHKELTFCGHSKIVNPKGEIVEQLGDQEGVLVGVLDLGEITAQRQNIPYLRDLDLALNQKTLKHLVDLS